MRLKVPEKKAPFENTIPLINVVFLILIFFLLAGTLTTQDAREVRPPETEHITEKEVPDGALFMATDGTLRLRGESVDAETAVARLTGEGDGPVKIFADRAAAARDLMRLVEQLKSAGADEVVLVTLRKGAR